MSEKQHLLASVVEEMIDRLLYPPCINAQGVPQPWAAKPCQDSTTPSFPPLVDLHIGVVTSSLGGHGADVCRAASDKNVPGQALSCSGPNANFTCDDRGHLVDRGERTDATDATAFPAVATWKNKGFLVWAPGASISPPGDTEQELKQKARALVQGADQIGCGYEAPLEAWYRFLVDPTPIQHPIELPSQVGAKLDIKGVDKDLLEQRQAFLRPDSLLGIVLISDENDCSIIEGVLPADVCDTPITGPGSVDDDGNPTGCSEPRKGWPAGYVEGNFDSLQTDAQGRVTGTPFLTNYLALQQKYEGSAFHLLSGTAACATDPYSPDCKSCYPPASSGQGCVSFQEDTPQLRCWDQKRRYGTDFLYPPRRYVDGLKSPKVYNREGYLVPNPLFSGDRTEQDIFLAAIVGVPWQDIARDPTNLVKGYKPVVATKEAPGIQIDWDLILGDPFNPDPKLRKGPSDPLMVESSAARSGTHPLTKETIDSSTWNSINGHEWNTGDADLQYACIFLLSPSEVLDCSAPSASCDCVDAGGSLATQANPLCEGKTASGKGDGKPTTTQLRAKAYPAPRILQVVKDIGAQGILTSICTPNVTDASLSSYAYRPATRAINDALSLRLKGP